MARNPRLSAAAALLALSALAGCFAAVVPVPMDSQPTSTSAASPARTIGARALGGPWDTVSFAMMSWGHPVSSWRMLPDGSGSWTEAEREDGAPLGRYRLARHEIGPDEARAARLRALVEALPFPPPASEGCKNFITDQPYGKLRLENDAGAIELAYNAGCRDDAYAAFTGQLRAADALVSEAGRAAPVTRREEPVAAD